MTIKKKNKGMNSSSLNNINPKTGKKYSTAFKKRTIQYYLFGIYDESAILKKWHINSELLRQWRLWYYHAFEEQYCPKKSISDVIYSTTQKGNFTTRKRLSSERTTAIGGKTTNPKYGDSFGNSTGAVSTSEKSVKKNWRQGVKQLKKEYPYISIANLCAVYGKSRQAYYKATQKEQQEAYYADLIEEEVLKIRKQQPRCGAKKLYGLLKPFLNKEGIKKGRKKFIEVLKSKDLMLKKKKKTRKTTNSNHNFRKYPNLTNNLAVNCANQLWVSDITYVHFGTSFFYLSLIMDAYSRKIVRWNLSDNLKAEGPIAALKMAIATLPQDYKGLMHHSDRGIQYCSNAYVDLLKSKNIKISMTENGDPYENILIERLNRTIKEEFIYQFFYGNFHQAKRVVNKSVHTYNQLRPHASLDYLTPQKAHQLNKPLKKRWKNYRKFNTNSYAINAV